MRAVIQRVSQAEVVINNVSYSKINKGILVLIAFSNGDSYETVKWMSNKIVNLRIFPDEQDKMNRSVLDSHGEIMIISNFTLYGDVKKGFRPNFMNSAAPEIAEPMYEEFVSYLKAIYPLKVVSGEFRAMMDIKLVNSGPVTVIIDKD